MRWIRKNGRVINLNITKYLCDFDSTKGSSGEVAVRKFLKKHSSTQVWCEQVRIPGELMTIDFLAPGLKIAIEFDGKFHHAYNKWAHKGSKLNFLAQIKRDVSKDEHLTRNSFQIIRLEDSDLPLTLSLFREKFEVYL